MNQPEPKRPYYEKRKPRLLPLFDAVRNLFIDNDGTTHALIVEPKRPKTPTAIQVIDHSKFDG